jgi:peroxiredoxin
MKNIFIVLLFVVSTLAYSEGYKPGDSAEDFKLKNVDNNFVSLSDYSEARGFIVIFTCNGCPYALAYEERIIALDKEFKSQGFPVIAINPNSPEAKPADSFDKMQERALEKGFTFPYLVDGTQEVYKAYGATVTPHVFVLQKHSDDLKVAYIGTIDNNYKDADAADKHYVQDAVKSLLSGSVPVTDLTKAIGCGIK